MNYQNLSAASQRVVSCTTSQREDRFGPKAIFDSKPKQLADVHHPIVDDTDTSIQVNANINIIKKSNKKVMKTISVKQLQRLNEDVAPWEQFVSEYDYEQFETYVRSSGLSLFRVKAVGDLHFNVYNDSGGVERCNRLIILTSLGSDQDILHYTYLCDHDALCPPKVGQIVDAKLHYIGLDEDSIKNDYYWAESITPINDDVEINLVDNDYFY